MNRIKEAMQRANEEREDLHTEVEERGESLPSTAPKNKEYECQRENINPTYNKTRHLKVDKKTLTDNKVVSISRKGVLQDQLKILYTQILSKMEQTNGNSLLITSSNKGEGKSFTAIKYIRYFSFITLAICYDYRMTKF